MCDIQTLAYSTEGYIIRCATCKRMQLAFGIVAVVLNESQFFRLKEIVAAEMLHKSIFSGYFQQKTVSLPVTASTLLCLSDEELDALSDLLDQAGALLEVYEILTVTNDR